MGALVPSKAPRPGLGFERDLQVVDLKLSLAWIHRAAAVTVFYSLALQRFTLQRQNPKFYPKPHCRHPTAAGRRPGGAASDCESEAASSHGGPGPGTGRKPAIMIHGQTKCPVAASVAAWFRVAKTLAILLEWQPRRGRVRAAGELDSECGRTGRGTREWLGGRGAKTQRPRRALDFNQSLIVLKQTPIMELPRINRMLACLNYLFLAILCAQAQQNKLENNGGHYRFANIRWRRLCGNTVEFTLQTAWRRDYSSTYWKGSGPDGYAITGIYLILSPESIARPPDINVHDT